MRGRPAQVVAAVWLAAGAALIYGVDCGQGFIKDDYAWIASSRLDGWGALRRMFVEAPMGFYRPLVSLSFGLNQWLSGVHPLPYGLTNLALALIAAGLIAALTRRLGLPVGAALFAAGVWIFNFHGINMAILWVSGRTSLIVTIWAVAAACAFVRSHFVWAGVLVAMALFSKEEPILLPVVLGSWTAIDRRTNLRGLAIATWPSFIALGVYLALRTNTGAMTPATAPDYYHLSLAVVPANTLQYLDRSLTWSAVPLLLGAAIMRRREYRLTSLERSIVMKGVVWLVLGFALTVMVPVRSSLYACFPSVGAALIAAAVASAEWRAMRARSAVVVILLLLPLVLLPVYRTRNARMKAEARLGSETLRVIERAIAIARPDRVVVYDDPHVRPSIAASFGNALPEAVHEFVDGGSQTDVVVVPSVDARSPGLESGALILAMRDGHLIPVNEP